MRLISAAISSPVMGSISMLSFCGLGKEIRVLHGRVERAPQRLEPVGRHVGRRDERPGEALRREDEVERLAVLLGLGIVEDERRVRQVRRLLEALLQDDVDLVPVEPRPRAALDAAPRPAEAAVDLALLHGVGDVVAAGIAQHQRDLGAGQVLRQKREAPGIVQKAGRAERGLGLEQVGESLDRRRVPRHRDRDLAAGGADRVQAQRVVFARGRIEQRVDRIGARHHADDRAVVRRGGVEMEDRGDAAGAGTVLDDDGGLARNVIAQMARQKARGDVVKPARRIADDELYVLALVERCDAVVGFGGCREKRGEAEQQRGGQSVRPSTAPLRGSAQDEEIFEYHRQASLILSEAS